MKRYECSMQKKKESISKALPKHDWLDAETLEKEITSILDSEGEDIKKDVEGSGDDPYFTELALETIKDSGYYGDLCERIQDDMYKYVNSGDYAIPGNFERINWSWDEDHKDGIKFNELRNKLLDGIDDADTNEFSTWAIDWFFKAFGTFGITYKFRDTVNDIAYEYEHEDDDPEESLKKGEARTKRPIESFIGEEKILFKYTEIPNELKQVYNACKKRFNCKPNLVSMVDSSDMGYYKMNGSYGSDVKIRVEIEREDGKFIVSVDGLDETTGYHWETLGKGESENIKQAIDSAMAEVDKNLMPFATKIHKAIKGESKKSEAAGDELAYGLMQYRDEDTKEWLPVIVSINNNDRGWFYDGLAPTDNLGGFGYEEYSRGFLKSRCKSGTDKCDPKLVQAMKKFYIDSATKDGLKPIEVNNLVKYIPKGLPYIGKE